MDFVRWALMAGKQLATLGSVFALVATCVVVTQIPARQEASGTTDVVRIEFLTRDGCVNSALMLANLRQAIVGAGASTVVDIVDQGKLRNTDARRGYGTPTILVNGVDPFGQPEPVVPFPPPS